ncbi:hypothetical protein GCM10027404_02700 [Arthrobacter tumbae]
MPTYAYACRDCGHAFDVQQSFSDDSLTVCPECEGRLRKKFNSVGVVFKGSGFYRTDSRASSSSVETGNSPAAKPAGTSSGSEGKAPSTPAKSSGTSSSSSSSAKGSATAATAASA